MKRLVRIIFNLLTVVSAILFVAAVALCVRSYWRSDVRICRSFIQPVPALGDPDSPAQYVVGSYRGFISFAWINYVGWSTETPKMKWLVPRLLPGWPTVFGRAKASMSMRGFYFYDEASTGYPYLPAVRWFRMVSISFWPIILVSAILPATWTYRYLQTRRRRPLTEACRVCGYDLRATRDRCPECGAACKAASPAGVSPAAGD
jgi:hypothetical protein